MAYCDTCPHKKNLELKHELLIICEGKADENFIKKLIEVRIDEYDFPQFDILNTEGKDNFDKKLLSIKGNRHFENIRAILIMADSNDSPEETFKNICKQIEGIKKNYPIPSKLLEVKKVDNMPAICVMLLPNEKEAGSLETLCVEELKTKDNNIENCVNKFFACGEFKINEWNKEKQAKAKYASMVAVLNKDDPSKAVSYAFTSDKIKSAMLDVSHACYSDVAKRISNFCKEVLKN